ncbi:MAG: hypothetical protein RLY47_177 [Candidatus Parcubacteria bacterium]|jgi:hypothetical protein
MIEILNPKQMLSFRIFDLGFVSDFDIRILDL